MFVSFRGRDTCLKEMVQKMNFNNKKSQKIISTVIIVVLILALIVPTVLSVIGGLL